MTNERIRTDAVRSRRMHFVGIGGAGMSALAEIMKNHGHRVTGSDLVRTRTCERLESLGIAIQYDHRPKLVADADLVVYSSAIRADNPERQYASQHGTACLRRADMLGELMRAKFSIGVSGTHGKTTTTSLVGHVLSRAGHDPTVVVGGTMRASGSNAVVGRGGVLVAEADEYDRSFLSMYPSIAVITNIEADHLDCYKGIDDIKAAFLQYAGRVPFYGAVVVCADDANADEIASRIGTFVVTYGTGPRADYCARDVRLDTDGTGFSVVCRGAVLGRAEVPLAGLHNVRNCLAAIAVCREMGVAFDVVREALRDFPGIARRFERIGVEKGITVVDDYAHHPSEIAATLGAARTSSFNRVVAVFQPHLYTRTRDFADEFARSLCGADLVVVTGIYKAREEPIPGVSAADIVERMRAEGFGNALYLEDKGRVVEELVPQLRCGDGVVLMGAGDICEIGPQLLRRLADG